MKHHFTEMIADELGMSRAGPAYLAWVPFVEEQADIVSVQSILEFGIFCGVWNRW